MYAVCIDMCVNKSFWMSTSVHFSSHWLPQELRTCPKALLNSNGYESYFYPQFCDIHSLTKSFIDDKEQKFYKRDFSHINHQNFFGEVHTVGWDETIMQHSPDQNLTFDSFYTKLSKIVCTCIPVKQLSKREIKMQNHG